MSVSNGEDASESVFNSSFMSREDDTNTLGKVDLDNADAASGGTIENIQRSINGVHSFVGSNSEGTHDQNPSWLSDNIVGAVSNESVKDRVDAIQAIVEILDSSDAGGGSKSWLIGDNANFEDGIGDWEIQANTTPAALPETAPGGTPSGDLSIERTTDTGSNEVLGGSASLAIRKTGSSNIQGEQVVVPFVIDSVERGQMQSLNLKIKTGSGYVNEYWQWFVRATDSGEEEILNVYTLDNNAGKIFSTPDNGTGFSGVFFATQSLNYELVLFAAGTSTADFDLFIDEVKPGPVSSAAVGYNATEWEIQSSPTIGATTTAPTKPTGINVDRLIYRRDGSDLIVRYEYSQSNTTSANVGSGDYLIPIPTDYQIDTAKVSAYSTAEGTGAFQGRNSVGSFVGSTSAQSFAGGVAVYDSTRVRFFMDDTGATRGAWGSAFHGLTATDLFIAAEFRVPIQGWQATSVMSQHMAQLQTVSASASGNPASATSGNPIIFPTKRWDEYNLYNATTGIFTCPRAGKVKVYGFALSGNAGVGLFIYKNGVSDLQIGLAETDLADPSFIGTVSVATGDTLSLRPNGTFDASDGFVVFEYLPDLSVVGLLNATKVAYLKDVKSANTAGGTATSGSFATRTLNTVEGDTDIVSLSSNQFMLQPGKYKIKASVPGYGVGRHKAKLRNITDSTDQIIGSSGHENTTNTNSYSFVEGVVIITSAKTFEIQHRVAVTNADDGFGLESNFGVNEVYTIVEIHKLQ